MGYSNSKQTMHRCPTVKQSFPAGAVERPVLYFVLEPQIVSKSFGTGIKTAVADNVTIQAMGEYS